MFNYRISFSNTMHNEKPTRTEIGKISNSFIETDMNYKEIAEAVGESGCAFCPATFDGKRKEENFKSQQLISLDFDNGVPFYEIKSKAKHYQLSILFAYKTFSYTTEHEKFRVVFALDNPVTDFFTAKSLINIFMKIFDSCDKACKDSARMFFGGKGLLYLADSPSEISIKEILIAFNSCMAEKYDEKHYSREIQKFYVSNNIEYKKNIPIINNGSFFQNAFSQTTHTHKSVNTKKSRRQVTRNLDWNTMYKRCRLFREFFDGSKYYYYPELYHIASNMINIENGKNIFLNILCKGKNAEYEAYHKCNWKIVLNTLIGLDYKPGSCVNCLYEKDCLHAKNMILTAKPGKSTILPVIKKEYVSIKEAEADLKEKFLEAVYSEYQGLHIIRAQTGIGKTNLYLNHMMEHPDEKFLIAVPTHKLKMEIYYKALKIGIANISYTPELPHFSNDLNKKIEHIYHIGAGKYIGKFLEEYSKRTHRSSESIMYYLEKREEIREFKGNIITTHERILLENGNSRFFKDRTVIIDEDIIRSMIAVKSISCDDIIRIINDPFISTKAKEKMKKILLTTGYQEFKKEDCTSIDIMPELIDNFENIEGDISALCNSRYLYNDGKNISFIERKFLSCEKAIIMSATANADIYKMYTFEDIYYYECKEAEYKGKLELDAYSTYSRFALNMEGMIDKIKDKTGDDEIITFMCTEKFFDTKYHYGAIEGLNCLEGRNISVIGLPNISDIVYILYGMAAGMRTGNYNMRSMRIVYNGYDFRINTFESETLRKIHLWMLESHIEQAVGRARLLRYDCTAKVFARFPVSQAILL